MAKLGKMIAGLGAIAGGYVQGDRMLRRDEREEEERRMRREEHDLRMRTATREEAAQLALADAGKTAVVEPNITNDDDGNPSSAPPIRLVGPGPVRNFDDPAAAQAAATGLNDAGARRARQIAALDAHGKPTEAITLEAAGIKLRGAHRDEANALFRERLATAMAGGHEGMAQFLTGFEYGPAKGKKVQVALSPDGKSAVYNLVNEDGTLKPFFTTTNDERGIAEAGYRFDRMVTPENRKEMWLKESKEAREAKLADSTVKKNEADAKKDEAQARYYDAYSNLRSAQADGSVPTGGKGQYKRMDEGERIRMQQAFTGYEAAEKAYLSALEKVEAGTDPAASPLVKHAEQRLKVAQDQLLKTRIQLGQMTSAELADIIANKATTPAEAMQSLNQLRNIAPQNYVDDVAGMLQEHPRYVQLANAEAGRNPQTPSGRAIAKAPPGSVRANPAGGYEPTVPGAAPPARAPVAAPAAAIPLSAATAAPAAPTRAPAAPANDPLVAALGGASGNPAIDNIIAQRAPALRQVADSIRAGQEQVRAAAQRGDTAGVTQASQAVARLGADLDKLLKDMMPAQQQRVKQALGVL